MKRRVEILDEAAVCLSGLNLRDYFLDEKAFRKYWECGVKPLQLIFHDEIEHVALPSVACPHISYGHLAALGATITYPDDSQPNVERMFESLAEGIAWLRREHDFANNVPFKRYVKYTDTLRGYFSDNTIPLSGLGSQGPLTTAVLLRGQDFYVDLYEHPEEAKDFLTLATDSVIQYIRFHRKLRNEPEMASASWLADDFAALVSPDMFGEFVVPFWNRLCEGTSSGGSRWLHCEGLAQRHLPYLEKAGFGSFQPSVSPKLTAEMLAKELKIEFDWFLPPFEIMMMGKGDIERWVADAAPCGAAVLRTEMDRQTLRENGIEKMRHFLNAFHRYD